MDYFSILILVVAVVLVFLFIAFEYVWSSYETSDMILWMILLMVWLVTIALYILYIVRYSAKDRCDLQHDLRCLCLMGDK